MSDKNERGLRELYDQDPERADWLVFGRITDTNRRGFLKGAGLAAMTAAVGAASIPFARHMPGGLIPAALAEEVGDFEILGKEGIIIRNDRPINLETPVHLLDDEVTPIRHFFVRNNGGLPEASEDPDGWRLTIDGEVESPLEFSLGELKTRFETITRQAQLECGGNGRAGFNPSPRGNQWVIGAVGNGEWTGCRLKDVLEAAGVGASAVYTAHYGADPHLSGDPGRDALSRGVPIDKALEEQNMLVWGMNGEPLPLAHGGPLRLLIPGWAGSCSQKWVTRIWLRDQEHDGQGMTGLSYRVPRYPVEPGAEVPDEDMVVMASMPVKSVITYPQSPVAVSRDEPLRVRGHAWAGDHRVAAMHVSIDFGATWQEAALDEPVNPYAWQHWRAEIELPSPGYFEVWARATDDQGVMQPAVVPGWNPRGYLNNSQHRIAVRAV
ncbi:sulfite oxidase [Halomonas sp. 328]|uniref:sulfite oxidase n=1 Tax=Halomonas sp. 328 TaxID=2776704 RepID=UPI0018A6DD1A|nr:sulfite oxidase [Halomonas sp. 328]MBF8221860.1 sulfite oxidase [Halomonas sp. 328]